MTFGVVGSGGTVGSANARLWLPVRETAALSRRRTGFRADDQKQESPKSATPPAAVSQDRLSDPANFRACAASITNAHNLRRVVLTTHVGARGCSHSDPPSDCYHAATVSQRA